MALILFTAFVGMLLFLQEWVPLQPLVAGLLGIGMAAATGAAVNKWGQMKLYKIKVSSDPTYPSRCYF